MFEKLLLTLSILILIAFVSAGCIQDLITPTYIEPAAMTYSDCNDLSNGFYTSLFDAERVMRKLNFNHLLNQMELQNQIDNDVLVYNHLKDAVDIGIQNGQELRDNIFSPSSPIGMLFPALTGLGVGWLGLSKPSDKKKMNGTTI